MTAERSTHTEKAAKHSENEFAQLDRCLTLLKIISGRPWKYDDIDGGPYAYYFAEGSNPSPNDLGWYPFPEVKTPFNEQGLERIKKEMPARYDENDSTAPHRLIIISTRAMPGGWQGLEKTLFKIACDLHPREEVIKQLKEAHDVRYTQLSGYNDPGYAWIGDVSAINGSRGSKGYENAFLIAGRRNDGKIVVASGEAGEKPRSSEYVFDVVGGELQPLKRIRRSGTEVFKDTDLCYDPANRTVKSHIGHNGPRMPVTDLACTDSYALCVANVIARAGDELKGPLTIDVLKEMRALGVPEERIQHLTKPLGSVAR